jgi:fatty-acyl-CoA synthase
MPDESQRWTVDGWFRTGDVCTIDSEGFVTIVDRIKDMIKSGGEWISSVDLENAVMGYPNVQEAAVVAVPHPTWTERPLALIVCKDGEAVSTEDLLRYLRGRFSKWQLPDAVVFVKELPKTSTGKLFKKKLREQYRTWNWEKSGPDIN